MNTTKTLVPVTAPVPKPVATVKVRFTTKRSLLGFVLSKRFPVVNAPGF